MYDELYKLSKEEKHFIKLYELIINENNIIRAYRATKGNKGARTAGTDGKTIDDIKSLTEQQVISLVRNKLEDYKPQTVKRVMIPKPNGKLRPLGIPTISDRLVQQCILQILKPIVEAKMHPHSYGFRDNRSAHHAMARVHHMVHQSQITYVVDVDIKSFFDNVDHNILIKQMWNMGIRDKRIISIIKKLLKAPIEGEGIPTKGTPQGGIISPLLSNIYLNELDWWISSQWETFETKHEYSNQSKKFRALKTTDMKEIWLVRYADDFKIMCRDYQTAVKSFHAVTDWLKKRLHLDISPEKSKVVNLKTNYTEFLGFKIKTVAKGNKWVVQSYICDKSKKKILRDLKDQIKSIQKCKPERVNYQVGRYNSMILGYHNYYKVATHVNKDMCEIEYKLVATKKSRLKDIMSVRKGNTDDKSYQKLYPDYVKNYRIYHVGRRALYPIGGVRTKAPMNLNQITCDFTVEGRKLIHDNLISADMRIVEHLVRNPNPKETVEYNDNRVSLYVAQNGKCRVTGKFLNIDEISCHHKKPRSLGGSDKYANLVILHKSVHKLIHVTKDKTVEILTKEVIQLHERNGGKKNPKKPNEIIQLINQYREKVENTLITS